MSVVRRILRTIEPHPGEHFKDKAIAVGLALMLWLAVNAEETVLQIFQAVPVEVANLPQGLAIAEPWDDVVTVRARGSQGDLRDLTAGLLSQTIDLSDAVVGDNFYSLLDDDRAAPRGIQIESVDPAQIRIVLEERIQKEVPVSAVTSGEPAPGFEVVGRRTEPDTVIVAGPRSAVVGMERVPTTAVDLSGRREAFQQAVTLVAGNPFVELPRARTVQLFIDVVEQALSQQFDGVGVEVINNAFRVTVNPDQLSVVLSAPSSVLEQVELENLRMVIDADGLEPRREDYLLEPQVEFGREGLSELIEVIAILPQRRINVHVYDQPGRQ
jgi:hypothetical protein